MCHVPISEPILVVRGMQYLNWLVWDLPPAHPFEMGSVPGGGWGKMIDGLVGTIWNGSLSQIRISAETRRMMIIQFISGKYYLAYLFFCDKCFY